MKEKKQVKVLAATQQFCPKLCSAVERHQSCKNELLFPLFQVSFSYLFRIWPKKFHFFTFVILAYFESPYYTYVTLKLTFSGHLRCLNFPLWILWPAKTKQVQESNLFCDTAPTKSGKFKHLKFSENDKFVETNSIDSILGII